MKFTVAKATLKENVFLSLSNLTIPTLIVLEHGCTDSYEVEDIDDISPST